jgi:hypothetical protein
MGRLNINQSTYGLVPVQVSCGSCYVPVPTNVHSHSVSHYSFYYYSPIYFRAPFNDVSRRRFHWISHDVNMLRENN